MEYVGVEIWDESQNLKSKLDFMNNSILSIDLSYSNTLTSCEDHFLYANPGEKTTIYKIDSQNQIPTYSIDFGKNKIPEHVFAKTKELQEANYIFTELPHKVFWVQNVIESDDYLSFWFIYGVGRYQPLYYQMVYDKVQDEVVVYSELEYKDTDLKLSGPLGVVDGKFISTIYTEEVEDKVIENENLKRALQENGDRETPILVICRL